MERSYLEELENILSKMLADSISVRKAAKRSPMNRLMIAKDHGKMRFTSVSYKNGARKRRVLQPDDDYIYRLAHKTYNDELLRRLSHNSAVLEHAFRQLEPTDFADILKALPKHYDILDPQRVMEPGRPDIKGFPNPSMIVFPNEARLSLGNMDPWEWATAPYCENTEYLEYKIHPTSHGINCRSKSEALLFEIYDSLEIPFHYDEVITIGGTRISPDFVGARRDGALIFQEHKGVHSDEYRSRNDWKSGTYAAAGILPGVNLIYTYDSPAGTLNVQLARELIKDMYWL